ncbi:hypothetical protein [Flavilitoribacter nigricans]|uniref:hypothetical protein n=1 Tax=Flavilitoribacter nigricans TaxID=70997 RepID=UPI001473F5D5|nr:hypothetical protein [Flavilitoribacter nigricans]
MSLPDYTLTFSTQKQIDDFSIDYPECVDLSKFWVYIDGASIRSLEGLSQLTEVRGLDIINTYTLENLHGLENLTSVLGRVLIRGNQGLKDLNGLSGFTSLGIFIENNPALTSLRGLENLTAAGLKIVGNESLENLEGLENVQSIGTLEIYENDALLNLKGLKNIVSIGVLKIGDNNALRSLEGLENLEFISSITIRDNDRLTSLAGIENVPVIGRFFYIERNAALTNLDALHNLTALGSPSTTGYPSISLSIEGNTALGDLRGLNNLTSIGGGRLFVGDNAVLRSLSGLDNIDPATMTGIELMDSPQLTTCHVKSICDFLSNTESSNYITISGNAVGCRTRVEIEGACEQ